MKSLFITGTDTSAGKTFICGCLLDYFIRKGVNVGYQKWVSTGDTGRAADLLFCEKAACLPETDSNLQVPYSFTYPASPHLAAEKDGQTIHTDVILAAFNKLRKQHDLLLVEGAGGVLVPLRRDLLLADLVAQINIPALIVARSGLGTINHSLLTIEALRHRSIPVAGVVFTDTTEDIDENLVADNMRIIAELGKVPVFGRMKHLPGPFSTARARVLFEPIGNALSSHI
jgi:dethiobiotin synthetase